MSASDSGNLRASDADRERVVAALREHVAEGRLTFDEFNQRVDAVYAAKTTAELQQAVADLPVLPADAQRPSAPPARRRRWWSGRATQALTRWATINGICVAIWAASGSHGPHSFWPIWVLIPTTVLMLRRACGAAPHRSRSIDAAAERRPHHGPPRQRQQQSSTPERVVMSVLFVDIVGSTERAVAMGDAAWRLVADEFERNARQEIRNRGGRTLFTRGDEIVAGFPSAAAAVAAAFAVRSQANRLGLRLRSGVHAGEVERRGRKAEGIAMHIGRRVCETAAPDQVLVSSTVRDLLNGSDIRFDGAGEHTLKGLDGTWQLYQPMEPVAA